MKDTQSANVTLAYMSVTLHGSRKAPSREQVKAATELNQTHLGLSKVSDTDTFGQTGRPTVIQLLRRVLVHRCSLKTTPVNAHPCETGSLTAVSARREKGQGE